MIRGTGYKNSRNLNIFYYTTWLWYGVTSIHGIGVSLYIGEY